MRRRDQERKVVRAVAAVVTAVVGATPASGQCETDKLLASNGSSGDFFGTEVDISEDVMIVGGFFANAAYVYRFDGSSWVEEAVLVSEDSVPNDLFGKAVAISGDVAVIGANSDDDNGRFAGSAYVFRFDRMSCTWIREAKLLASDGEPDDRFGWSVAISGETVVVGAFFDDNENGALAGAAYVFRFDGSSWVEEAKLLASDGEENDFFGQQVAIDGDLAIAGAFGDDDNGTSFGSAYVFRFNGTVWVEEAKLLDSNGAPFDLFGDSVAISGDAVVVGAHGDDNGGSAFVFRFNGLSWTQEAHLLASDGEAGDTFGGAVSIDVDVIIVGSTGNDQTDILAGAAYIYRWNGFSWLEEAKLLALDGAVFDSFGTSVAIAGDVAVVGADKDDDNGGDSGSVYVFVGLDGADCDSNGVTDACEILAGTSKDSDGDGILDVCECPWDLQGDAIVGITDFLDMLAAWGTDPGGPPDFDGDGVVGILDFLELLANWGLCPVFLDCNGNGVFDPLDIANGSSADCNLTGVPDECDIAGGSSTDVNGNGIPDECEPLFNDTCEDAIPILDGVTPFLTVGATTGGPLAICKGFTAITDDIWFLYTAPCTGIATFSLCNDATFDTRLALYFGGSCPPPLNPLACSDNAAGCGQTSEIQQAVAAGFSYLVRLGGAEGGGAGILTVSCEP